MATLHKDIALAVSAAVAWAAVRDVGQVHRRLCPGVLVDARLDGDARIVTFANGNVVRELIVSVDDSAKRLVWSARSERLHHHDASMQVLAERDDRCRLVWIADLLPDTVAPAIESLMDAGLQAIERTLVAGSGARE